MRSGLRFALWGTGFGFVLSRAGATDFDLMSGMFRFTDLHLVGSSVAPWPWARWACASPPVSASAPAAR